MPEPSDRPPPTVLLRAVRPWGGELSDVRIESGRISQIGPHEPAAPETGDDHDDVAVIDGDGALAIPGLVDAHAHLDKTTWGLPWRPHSAEPGLAGLIANEREHRGGLGADVAERAGNLLETYVAMGVTHVRSHVDVDPDAGLSSLEGVRAAADRLRHAIDVELVAFPQSGLLAESGTLALVTEAVSGGLAQVVGGLDPAGFDGRPETHLDAVFSLATKHAVAIDIHLHDRGELGAWQIERICDLAAGASTGGVTISHAFGIATVDAARQADLVARLADADVALTTVAPGNVAPLPLPELQEAGVAVGLGQDGIRDLWSPWGNGDLLRRAGLLAWRSGWRRDDDIERALLAATHGGASVLGSDGYGLDTGCWADLVLLDCATPAAAVVTAPPRRLTMKHGRIIVGA